MKKGLDIYIYLSSKNNRAANAFSCFVEFDFYLLYVLLALFHKVLGHVPIFLIIYAVTHTIKNQQII
ncbi:hypothetical protein BpHYR1_031518 [Brachionus plicatilis]|uniref:Uncharacterized protein n=1 Tax=Brachionus plicatilis TaxID=10195 RepID=A0A3M7T241_BRAPC|nr:hypothetical protein BpHYR1_031518 [Brachionus plicatilis]